MNHSHRHDLSSSVNSADAESHRGTPETRSTALSPEDLQLNQCGTNRATLMSDQPPAFSLGAPPSNPTFKGKLTNATVTTYHDPFVTFSSGLLAARSSERPKLSPNAPTFTPTGLLQRTDGDIVSQTLRLPLNPTGSAYGYTPTSLPSASMVPGTPYDQGSYGKYSLSATTGTHLSQSNQTSPESLRSPSTQGQPPKSGRFSSDSSTSRSIMISQIDRGTPPTDIEIIINVSCTCCVLAMTNDC